MDDLKSLLPFPPFKLETIEEVSQECSISERPANITEVIQPCAVDAEEFPKDYNFIRLTQDALSSEDTCIEWLRKYRLLARRKLCIHCEQEMEVCEMPCRGDPRCFLCNRCQCTASLRNGSVFMCFNRPFIQIVPFIYLWTADTMNLQAIEYETEIGNVKKVRDFAQVLREVCVKKVAGRCNPCVGGARSVVEVGVARFSRNQRVVGHYILAAVGRTTAGQPREIYIDLVPNAKPDVVTAVLNTIIRPGSIVLTSKWKSYGMSMARNGDVKQVHVGDSALKEVVDEEDLTVIVDDLVENDEDVRRSSDSETCVQQTQLQNLVDCFTAVDLSEKRASPKTVKVNEPRRYFDFSSALLGDAGFNSSRDSERKNNESGHLQNSVFANRSGPSFRDVLAEPRASEAWAKSTVVDDLISLDETEGLARNERKHSQVTRNNNLNTVPIREIKSEQGNISLDGEIELPSIVFLDPSTMGYTPTLNALWLNAKKKYRKTRSSQGSFLVSLLQELAWREMYGSGTVGETFRTFILHLQEQYPLL